MKFIKVVILFLTILLQGCNQVDVNIESKILPPKPSQIYSKGVWKTGDKTIIIDENAVVFDKEICLNPEYKVKSVSANSFFQYKHNTDPKSIGIEKENVEIISVSDDNQLFYDFIKISDDKLAVYTKEGLLILDKISEDTEAYMSKLNLDSNITSGMTENKEGSLLRSGVLLGLNSDTYRTLWISSRNRQLQSIVELPQLLVPRKAGFWEVGLDKEGLYAYPKGMATEKLLKDYSKREVTFVGNDYIGMENTSNGRLQVLPIDNVSNERGINISDIVPGELKDNLNRSAEAFLSTQGKELVDKLEKEPSQDNFTISRRNGHWIMKGRLNYIYPTDDKIFEEFDIYGTPPRTLINYDELYVTWSEVKAKAPDAIDVFTSPNKEVAVVVSKNYVYVYSVMNGKLSDWPMDKVKLKEGESVIMAEWATGDYVEKWKEVIKNN